ncbi:unnamed protein product, partial [Mesorhabditis spiculigera]
MTPIPTEGELLRFGSLNIMLSVGGICLQIWYIKFLYARRPGWGRDIVLTLHLLSAFCDIVQLSAHGFAGLQMFFPEAPLPYSRYLLSKKPDWGKGVVVILFLLTAVCDVFQLIAHCYVALAMIFPVTLEPYCGVSF